MEEWRGDKMFILIIHTVDTKDSCIQTVTTLVHLFPTWNTHRLPTRHFDRVLRCSQTTTPQDYLVFITR